MTAAVTPMGKARSGPSLVAQLLFYPVTNARFDTDSYREFATGSFLRAAGAGRHRRGGRAARRG